YFRANFDALAQRLSTRGNLPGLESFKELDQRRRAAIAESEQLKARRNAASGEIAQLRRQGVDTSSQQQEVRQIGERIAALDEQVKSVDEAFRDLLAGIPNIPHDSVPVGRDASANVEVRRVGEPPRFDFSPQPHWDLGPALGILDLERA